MKLSKIRTIVAAAVFCVLAVELSPHTPALHRKPHTPAGSAKGRQKISWKYLRIKNMVLFPCDFSGAPKVSRARTIYM